jgi:GT2 family glycosyltransferase/tetratricopeptide (TPR) repeat protein
VVVVDDGSTDATAARLSRYPWVQVVTNGQNLGFAAACNRGAALATGEILVFLNNDTLVSGRWLDALCGVFSDPSLGAAGARSNFVSGSQMVAEAASLRPDPAAIRSFVRSWEAAHRGMTTPTTRLVGFCLAVRRAAFEKVGGFDESYGSGGFEDDDLCLRLTEAGYGLVIADECFVYHAGHVTFDANGLDWYAEQRSNEQRFFARHATAAKPSRTTEPLVSACMIVRDEEVNLPGCLASLKGLVDEVVVYDTGSLDSTPELAASLGARVTEGYWDDDFSRARNASLEECRGTWILWIDADETLVCEDAAGLRRLLATMPDEVDGLEVSIENLSGSRLESSFTHVAVRLFRRERCRWHGRLHEQISRRNGAGHPRLSYLPQIRLLHTGYSAAVFEARSKAARNVRLAEKERSSEHADDSFAELNLGRSLWAGGHTDEAISHCLAAARTTDDPTIRRLALRTAILAMTSAGRFDEATSTIGELRAACASQVLPDEVEGELWLAAGDPARALEHLERVGRFSRDDDGFEHGTHTTAKARAQALAALGRHGEAADVLLDVLSTDGILPGGVELLVASLTQAGRSLDELAGALRSDRLAQFLPRVVVMEPAEADMVLESLWSSRSETPDAMGVLAAAGLVTSRLGLDRMLTWSARLRSKGLAEHCPLLAVAGDPLRAPVERVRAAASAHGAFCDPRARPALAALLGQMAASGSSAELEQVTAELELLVPDLVADLLAQPREGPHHGLLR